MTISWQPSTTIPLGGGTITTMSPPYPADPQVRIAMALERIASALEAANARHSVTVTTTPAKKPVIRKATARRKAR